MQRKRKHKNYFIHTKDIKKQQVGSVEFSFCYFLSSLFKHKLSKTKESSQLFFSPLPLYTRDELSKTNKKRKESFSSSLGFSLAETVAQNQKTQSSLLANPFTLFFFSNLPFFSFFLLANFFANLFSFSHMAIYSHILTGLHVIASK